MVPLLKLRLVVMRPVKARMLPSVRRNKRRKKQPRRRKRQRRQQKQQMNQVRNGKGRRGTMQCAMQCNDAHAVFACPRARESRGGERRLTGSTSFSMLALCSGVLICFHQI